MSNFRGLLDALRDPKNSQGLLDMGVSLMGASGPSPVPMSFGQRFAQGYMGSQQMAATRAAQALKAQQEALQMKVAEAQLAKLQKPEPASSPFANIDPSKYTQASVAKFQASGNYGDLVPIAPQANGDGPATLQEVAWLRDPARTPQEISEYWRVKRAPPSAPSGYAFVNGGQAPVPGGPADPNNPLNRGKITDLRKEFDSIPGVKNYKASLPLYQRALTAPNTRAGDLSVVYALAKIFDPESAVRGEELILSKDAQPWLNKVANEAISQVKRTGSLDPQTRAEIIAAMKGQVDAFAQTYQQEAARYQSYAPGYGAKPGDIVGEDPASAFKVPPQGGNAPKRLKFEDLPK